VGVKVAGMGDVSSSAIAMNHSPVEEIGLERLDSDIGMEKCVVELNSKPFSKTNSISF
tara:strand:- start:4032 stop:4205 length:174 start_codon:yes stop_codon:yes gene_type:complete